MAAPSGILRMDRWLWPIGIAFSWALMTALRSYDGFMQWNAIATGTTVFLAVWVAVFQFAVCGTIIWLLARGEPAPSENVATLNCDLIVAGLSLIAVLGAGCLVYEYAVNRSYSFYTPVRDIRITEVNNSFDGFTGSWLGGVGRLFVSALIVGYVVAGYYWRNLKPWSKIAITLATILIAFQQAKFEGGRFFFVILIGAGLVSSLFLLLTNIRRLGALNSKPWRQSNPEFIAIMTAMAIATHIYSGYVFNDRAMGQAGTLAERFASYTSSLQEAAPKDVRSQVETPQPVQPTNAASRDAQIEPAATERAETASAAQREARLDSVATPPIVPQAAPDEQSKISGASSYATAMAWLYITQGPNELDKVFQFRELQHGYGTYTFPQLGQLASKVSGRDMRYDIVKSLPSTGVYVTLPGAFYIDFGWIGAIILAAIGGVLTGAAIVSASSGMHTVLALAAPILIVVAAFSPITSVLANVWTSFLWIAAVYVLSAGLSASSATRTA